MEVVEEEKGDAIEKKINDKINNVKCEDEEIRGKLREILIKNKSLFRESPGRLECYEHECKVTDSTPYFQRGWAVPIAYKQKVDAEINKMLKYGVIERGNSPYVNPMVTVIKKDGNVRLCLDARKINSVTIPDYEGPPPIQEILARCGNMKYLSTVDLTSSFWQVPLKRNCRDFTAFMYEGKCYRYTVTPFGLSTSSAALTRGLDTALEDEVKRNTIIYVDDCLCYSYNIKIHLVHLGFLLRNLRRANLTINLEKSQFFRQEIGYLGYRLTTNGVQATEDKVAAIRNFPIPRNQKQLKRFLGLTNFYNRFTDKYAETTQPLLDLLKKGKKFTWTPELDRCFQEVKNLFVDTVILRFPKLNKLYFLQCDASNFAYGGQLYQLDEEGKIGVIAFTSKTFKGAEKNYFTTEKELLSIIRCLEKFWIYVLGQPLTIIIDNKAIVFMNKCHLNNSRITRWILSIQEYNFDIIYCKGKENIIADTLSRYPEDVTEEKPIDDNFEYQINHIVIKMNKDVSQKIKDMGKHQMNDKDELQ